MLSAMVIVFRESLEALIVISSLLTYVKKINNARLFKFIWFGSLLGIALSAVTGFVLVENLQSLQGYARQIFESSMMIFVSLLIAYNLFLISRVQKTSEDNIEKKYNVKPTGFSMFVIPLIVVYRESLEAIMMLMPLIFKPLLSLGILFGLATSTILMLFVYKFALKLKLSAVFTIITAIFIYMGVTLFGEGIAGLLPQNLMNIATAGKFIYAVPATYLFLKGELKRYIIRKQR